MKNNRSGIIILATLWIMAILAVFALGIGYRSSLEVRLAGYQVDKIKTLYLAKAAIQEIKEYMSIDSNNDTKDYDSLYRCGIYLSSGQTPEALFKNKSIGDGSYTLKYKSGLDENNQPVWRYGLSDEERKININKAGSNTLKILFGLLGIEPGSAESIAASIIDWRDADSNLTANGAENDYYQSLNPAYNCKNADFEILEELLLVKGVTSPIFNKIKDYLTVYGDGKVNINTASPVVLQTLVQAAGLTSDSAAFANNIIDYRNGNDRIEGTSDDNPCIPPVTLITYLGQAEATMAVEYGILSTLSNNYLTLKSTNFSAQIQATSADKKIVKSITVILDNTGAIKRWQEE